MPRYDADQIIAALGQSKGNQAEAARRLGCSRTTVNRWIRDDERVKAVYTDINESRTDEVEDRLNALIDNPDHRDHYSAIRFYLRTKARHRGWQENFNVEADVNGGMLFAVEFIGDEDNETPAD